METFELIVTKHEKELGKANSKNLRLQECSIKLEDLRQSKKDEDQIFEKEMQRLHTRLFSGHLKTEKVNEIKRHQDTKRNNHERQVTILQNRIQELEEEIESLQKELLHEDEKNKNKIQETTKELKEAFLELARNAYTQFGTIIDASIVLCDESLKTQSSFDELKKNMNNKLSEKKKENFQQKKRIISQAIGELERSYKNFSDKISEFNNSALVLFQNIIDLVDIGKCLCYSFSRCFDQIYVTSSKSNEEKDLFSRFQNLLKDIERFLSFDEDTPESLIKFLSPDVLVKGGDYVPDEIIGADYIKQRGGQVKVIPFVDGYSTSKIISSILDKN